ncbi:helix-turn-helix domain-containing protein [Maribacter sp. 2210JD10-5]|uniref:helix-turn-helix domain-containing protein n=1 Tax=Maribacter sp. 2210JD10-5 TaxID=3386272 RepID=UPI0039BC95F0
MKQPELGNRISALRKQKGFTQEELVERCNINVRTLQRIENGEVTPRSYTVRTILSALEHDFEEVYGAEAVDDYDIIKVDSDTEAKSIKTLLTLAGIFGIIYLITGPFEGFADYYRFTEDEMIFGTGGHIFIKILTYISYALMIYGFLISGKLLKNYLMKIASVLLIITLGIFYVYDIASLFYAATITIEAVLVAESIILGTVGILFGISILKSAKKLGAIGYAAGGLEIMASLCFLMVILSLMGLIVQYPAVIMEVVFLFKIRGMLKS